MVESSVCRDNNLSHSVNRKFTQSSCSVVYTASGNSSTVGNILSLKCVCWSCDSLLRFLQGNLTLLNNYGTTHLGKGEEPLRYMFKTLLCLWVVLLAYWITNWVKYREVSDNSGSFSSIILP